MKSFLYLFFFIPLLFSCTRELEYENREEPVCEVINGLTVKWLTGLPKEKKYVLRDIINNMIYVEGGSFTMGVNQEYDPEARINESPAHIVILSGFYICSRELTAEEIACLADNPEHVYPKRNSVYFSYSDWESIALMLSDYTGLKFDIPTEAQWEFSARGGIHSLEYIYPGSNDWRKVWREGTDDNTPGIANELGLYNMADGCAEWCKDMYAEYNANIALINPCNLYGENKVVRGGCSESNTDDNSWFKSFSLSSFFSSKKNYRICRSTARAYGNWKTNNDITWRPVINIENNEK